MAGNGHSRLTSTSPVDIKDIRSDRLARAQDQFKDAPKSESKEKKPMNNTTYKTFKLHPDQKEIVEAALEDAKKRSGTKFDTVALELVCQEYMGTASAGYTTAKAALTAEFKKSESEEEFLGKVAGYLEEITGKTITISAE